MQIRDILVRRLIFRGRITGMGREAKAKSVKMLTEPLKSPMLRNMSIS